MKITIEATVNAPINRVWKAWVTPEDITHWNFANDDWCCPSAKLDLVEGGKFEYRMEAKDGSLGFDLTGTYTQVSPNTSLSFRLDDLREVNVTFIQADGGADVIVTFEAETQNPPEFQRNGWQAILDNFKKYVEHSLS